MGLPVQVRGGEWQPFSPPLCTDLVRHLHVTRVPLTELLTEGEEEGECAVAREALEVH